jgi:prepilin-type N-terminal cleavage/methylation domain-containing protein
MRMDTRRSLRHEEGFTLVELLIVIVVLGILASVVLFAVGNARNDAESSACQTDYRVLQTAYEANVARFDEGADEAGLVANDFLREESDLYNVTAAGVITPTGVGDCPDEPDFGPAEP